MKYMVTLAVPDTVMAKPVDVILLCKQYMGLSTPSIYLELTGLSTANIGTVIHLTKNDKEALAKAVIGMTEFVGYADLYDRVKSSTGFNGTLNMTSILHELSKLIHIRDIHYIYMHGIYIPVVVLGGVLVSNPKQVAHEKRMLF